MRVLVFGGAGFIGSHLVDGLIEQGHQVRVFDSLDPQVHGNPADGKRVPPAYLNPKAEFVLGDVRDRSLILDAIQGIDAVYFFAAAVGVGQSMYEVSRYVAVNSLGGANFLDVLVNEKHKIKKVVVASSMSCYGEGLYQSESGQLVEPGLRSKEALEDKQWELIGLDEKELKPLPTPESKPLQPTSVYAVTKRDHEELFLSIGQGYGIPTVALRFFNVYGTRQALSNPYTGVAAIFSSAILNDKTPVVFEDGKQTRDFVHVSDIVQMNLKVLENDSADGQVFNVGSGQKISILELAKLLIEFQGKDLQPKIEEKFRVGDIRHCFADISKGQELVSYQPQVKIEQGIEELTRWVASQNSETKVEACKSELKERSLLW